MGELFNSLSAKNNGVGDQALKDRICPGFEKDRICPGFETDRLNFNDRKTWMDELRMNDRRNELRRCLGYEDENRKIERWR